MKIGYKTADKNIQFTALNPQKAVESSCAYFNKFVDNKMPSALKFLNSTPMSSDSVFKFLCHSTNCEYTAKKIAKEFSKNPRQSEAIKNSLIKKLNGKNNNSSRGYDMFMSWFHDEKTGYRNAYSRYYMDEVWSKANTFETLLKQSPNLAPWELEYKAQHLGKEFIFGKVPEDFISLKEYRLLIDKIKQSDFFKVYVNARNLETEFADNDAMLSATKTNELLSKVSDGIDILIGKETYKAKPIIQSFSSKIIYSLTSKSDKSKKYILKFDPYELQESTDMARKFTENQALRPDMPYLDSMIDFYLKYNNSPNAPDILLYDYLTKSVLYKATEGKMPDIPEKYLNNIYNFIRYNKIADIKKLGVELSDVHPDNFRVDKNGVFKLIDSGHAKYLSTFRPPVVSKHIITGNLCGREVCR